jgi:hypothetical protein
MNNRTRINYTFLLLAIGIVSTILSNPILAQTEGNSQNQTGQTPGGQQGGESGAASGGQVKGSDGIGSIEELQALTPDEPPTNTSNDTTPILGDLGKETSTDQGFAGDKEQQQGGQQEGNQTAGTSGGQQQQGGQQEGNQTAGTSGGQQQGGQQEGNQTAGTSGGQQQQGGQQEGNQTGNPLSDIGEQIGNLFK